MKASDAIRELEKIIKKHGDLPLWSYCAKERAYYPLSANSLVWKRKYTKSDKDINWPPECILVI